MSTSEPFLPEDPEPREEPAAQRAAHDSEDGQGPDVFPPDGQDSALEADEPPVADSALFRTPTGETADPSKD